LNLHRLIAVVFGILLLIGISSCAEQKSVDSSTSVESSIATDKAPRSELTPPITLVDAGEFADGGTTFVHLKAADQRELLLCVSESAFAEVIPANTLFLDASHPRAPAARLPLNEEEAVSIVSTLETALETAFPPSARRDFEKWGDPLEHQWHEQYTKPQSEQRSVDEWKKIFAWDALRRLKAKPNFATFDASNSTTPNWYEAFDSERRKQLAEERRLAAEDANFKRFYPEGARELLMPANVPAQVQVQPAESDSASEDVGIVQQGQRLVEAVGNHVSLAEISCKALGTLSESWTVSTTRDRIAIQAMLTVSPEDFVAALPQVAHDKRALLGAARFFFYHGYANKISAPAWEKWAPVLTTAVLDEGADENKGMVIHTLAGSENAMATELLQQIARGEIGREIDLSAQSDDEPGLKETAYLTLALRGDKTVRDEITKALTTAEKKQNIAALEVALALLGDPAYLKKENMEFDSYIISIAVLRAIERFDGKYGMDLLMTSGLDHNYAAVANEALLAAQRISGEEWIPEGSRFQPSKYADEARAWWKANRDKFERKDSQ
jgi:hypothetical protein